MSEPGATRARRGRRTAESNSRVKRTMVAIATVMLVITPISWILLHEPQSDQADASIPYITRDDDTYITPSNEPVVATSGPESTTPTPGATPTKPTRTPTGTPTPGDNPTTTPSGHPTTVPTDGPGDTNTPGQPTRTAASHGPKPTSVPSKPPSTQPPADDGSMDGDEQQLFSLIDDARVQHGCAPLNRNSNLTGGARDEAGSRAANNDLSSTGKSKASAGGDDMSAQAAFDRLKNESSSVLLNCGLTELGIGRGTKDYTTCSILIFCSNHTRVAWVADFQ